MYYDANILNLWVAIEKILDKVRVKAANKGYYVSFFECKLLSIFDSKGRIGRYDMPCNYLFLSKKTNKATAERAAWFSGCTKKM